MTGNPPSTKECISCSQDILLSSSKCHHCGDTQNIGTKTLGYYSMVIGFIITVCSLITLATAAMKEHILNKQPNVNGVVMGGEGRDIQFTLFNSGNAPAIIVGSTVTYQDSDKNSITRVLNSKDLPTIIAENKHHLVNASGSSKGNLPSQAMFGIESTSTIGNPMKELCALEVTYRDLESNEFTTPIMYKCLPG